MIRELVESAYKRTIGALWQSVSPVVARWGVAQLLYAAAVIGLMAGFVNAVALPIGGSQAYAAVYQGPGDQTYPETFIDAMVILLGGSGIYLTYISGRQTTKSRMVTMYLGFALLLISLAVITGIYLVNMKG